MKNKVKIILIIFLTMFLSITGTVIAQTLIKSSEVTYDNSKSKGSFENVQDSLDELYQKAGYTGEEYHEEILHGADPVLSGELIPVYLADNGDVYYANTHTKWYEYATKRWANAVILVDDAYGKYSTGQKINEEDIESYFVWIPRYAYKLWDLGKYEKSESITYSNTNYATSPGNVFGKARIIEITFGSSTYLSGNNYKKQIRDSETGLYSDPTDLAVDQWLIHPAFTLGTEELNGFWMGKFTTGINQTGDGKTSIDTTGWTRNAAQYNNQNIDKVIVKPNVYTWRGNNIYNFFMTFYNYKKNLNSHMLKNTEWGAVAYLSHSAYGIGTRVNINNNSDCLTGYSSTVNDESGTYANHYNDKYNSTIGFLASTTGNITGVYDMRGASQEYVAATFTLQNNTKLSSDKSGFTGEEIMKYIKLGYLDAYKESTSQLTYSNRILGDAIGEIGPFYSYYETNSSSRSHSAWYGEPMYMAFTGNPWPYRGECYSNGAYSSQFSIEPYNGDATWILAARLALTGKQNNN